MPLQNCIVAGVSCVSIKFEADKQDARSKVYRNTCQRIRKTKEYHTPPRGIRNEALQQLSTTSVSCHVARQTSGCFVNSQRW